MTKIDKAKALYESAVNNYVDLFCKQTKHYLEGWLSGEVGTIAEIADLFLNFLDIKFCVENKVSFDWLYHWYYFNLDNHEDKTIGYINLKSYNSLRKGEDLTDGQFTKHLTKFLKIKETIWQA